jgi:small subunit ribosomal protein S20
LANSSSARKRIRSARRKHEQNRSVRSAVRTAVAKARRSVLQPAPAGAEELVRMATSALDKAAEHGVLHRRNVSRRKSRLMKLAAKVSAEQAAPPAEAAPKRKPAAKATKSAAGTKKGAPAKSRTKTERTAARTRRTAGSSADKPA